MPGKPVRQVEVCAVVLLNAQHDVLLQLRDEKKGLSASGLWVFPGGHKELKEDIFSCAGREFLEETGYLCEHLNWLMSINDAFVDKPAVLLHIFWDLYQTDKSYTCFEGQALEFIPRGDAENLKMPKYLISIWDLAILAVTSQLTNNQTINYKK
jgi:8-oxo-dGTP pyrophosphatase MutT (NUDIX family)